MEQHIYWNMAKLAGRAPLRWAKQPLRRVYWGLKSAREFIKSTSVRIENYTQGQQLCPAGAGSTFFQVARGNLLFWWQTPFSPGKANWHWKTAFECKTCNVCMLVCVWSSSRIVSLFDDTLIALHCCSLSSSCLVVLPSGNIVFEEVLVT